MNRRKFLVCGAAMSVPGAFALAAASDKLTALTFSGAIPLVPVSLGDRVPILFVLDTGAAVTVIDRTLLGRTEIDSRSQNSGPSLGASARRFGVGGQGRLFTPAIADLAPISVALERPVLGLLGSDFLADFRGVIDFADRTLTLDVSNGGSVEGSIPMRYSRIPYVRASVAHGGQVLEGEFAIDTGLDSGVKLRREVAIAKFPNLTFTPGSAVTVRGRTAQNLARLDALRICGLDVPDVSASISEDAPPGGAGAAFVGTIGAPAFARRQVTLDFQAGFFRLSPVIL